MKLSGRSEPGPTSVWREKPWYETGASRRFEMAEYERLKRAVDLIICIVAIVPVLVLLAICGVVIKLDSPGEVWFMQERTGKGGRRFRMFKLRTMVHNAAELKVQYMHLNELSYPDFKITNDPRVTRCGRILRRLSLDELPQIFNVIRGDMTLVGPRPTSFAPETYSLWHTARLDVKPGLTGLWQVEGRSALDFDARLRLDIAYIRNRCPWLDARILVRTVTAVTSGRGAA